MNLADSHAANIGKPPAEQDLSIYAADLVVEFPFAPAGHTARLEGREALSRFLAAISDFTTGHRMENTQVVSTERGFTMGYRESSTFRSTGKPYASEILWTAEVRDGQIVHLREYYNPIAVLEALGEYVPPAG